MDNYRAPFVVAIAWGLVDAGGDDGGQTER